MKRKITSFILLLAMLVSIVAVLPVASMATDSEPTLKGTDVTLTDGILLNFYIEADESLGIDNAPLVDGYYVVTKELAAKEMGDDVTVKLKSGDTVVGEYTYSVADYADGIHAGNYDAQTKALVTAMLNYGAAAQKYFGYKTDALVGTPVTDTTALKAATVEDEVVVGDEFIGASLVLEGTMKLRFYFESNDGITVDGTPVDAAQEADYWYVDVKVTPDSFEKIYEVKNGSTIVKYSVLNYLKNSVDNPELSEIVASIYAYGVAAKEYVAESLSIKKSYLPGEVAEEIFAAFEQRATPFTVMDTEEIPYAYIDAFNVSNGRVRSITVPVAQTKMADENGDFVFTLTKIKNSAPEILDDTPIATYKILVNAEKYGLTSSNDSVYKVITVDLSEYSIELSADETLAFCDPADTLLPAVINVQGNESVSPVTTLKEKFTQGMGVFRYVGDTVGFSTTTKALCFDFVIERVFDTKAEKDAYINAEKQAKDEYLNSVDALKELYAGKNVSAIGDSISTYEGVSNNPAHNLTLEKNSVKNSFYPTWDNTMSSYAQTYWGALISELGMTHCVTNAMSGAFATGSGKEDSLPERATELHRDNGTPDRADDTDPDVILIYNGINDAMNNRSVGSLYSSLVSANSKSDYEKVGEWFADVLENFNANGGTVRDNASFSSFAEAYALGLYLMKEKYQDAEIYCITLLYNYKDSLTEERIESYNCVIKALAGYFGATVVDQNGLLSEMKTEDLHTHIAIGDSDCIHSRSTGHLCLERLIVKTMARSHGIAYDECEHEDADLTVISAPTLFSNGLKVGVCKHCGEDVTIAVEKAQASVSVVTTTEKEEHVIMDYVQIKEIIGDKHFYPTADDPDGNDLYVEFSMLFSESMNNFKGTNITFPGIYGANTLASNSGAPAFWYYIKTADGITAGKYDDWTSNAVNKNDPAKYFNKQEKAVEYDGWHRFGVKFHQNTDVDVANNKISYTVTVTMYIDGVRVYEAELDAMNTKKTNSHYLRLYEAQIVDGEVVYTDNVDKFASYYRYTAYVADANNPAYFVTADKYITVGDGFVLDVERVNNPGSATLEVDDGVELSAKAYYNVK